MSFLHFTKKVNKKRNRRLHLLIFRLVGCYSNKFLFPCKIECLTKKRVDDSFKILFISVSHMHSRTDKYCPRCHANWQEKKLSCSHCGNEKYENMKYITVDGKSTDQIHVCEDCKGYTKIIDTRQLLRNYSLNG